MGTTTSIKDKLFGDTLPYTRLLGPISQKLIIEYPHDDLRPIFESLPTRFITTGPMSMCARLMQDLEMKADPALLQAVGTLCLHISTHDDLVDEPPRTRHEKAGLLYAGNISLLEGCQLLYTTLDPAQAALVLTMINKNHLLQQRCVDLLWDAQPRTFEKYARGIEHTGIFIGIGVMAALAAAERKELWDELRPICGAYGTVIQILDDISEVDEDELAGYHSFPLHEGKPFVRSFEEIDKALDFAEQSLNPAWRNFGELITNVRTLTKQINDGYNAN